MQHSADYKNEWVWSPNLADLAPGADAFEKELDLLDLNDILALPTNLGLPGSTELLFTEIRGGYAPGPTSAITASSDSLTSCDSLDTLSAYSAAESFHAYAGLGSLSDALQSFDLNIGAALSGFEPSTPVVEASVDQQLRLLMDQQLESQQAKQQPAMSPATIYPPASSHPSLAGPVQLPTLPEAYTAASAATRTSLSPIDEPDLTDRGDADPRKKYACPKCDRRFARAFNLKTHIATHDPNRVKSFKCRHPGCGRSFSRKHDLGRHLVSIHQDHEGVDAKPTSSSSSAIGVGASKAGSAKGQRVWCDSCGRGWVKGSGQECACSSSDESSIGGHP